MSQSDYVLRLVEGFSRIVARIVAGRRAGRLDEAQAEIASAAASVAGVEMTLVDLVGIEVIGRGMVDPARREVLRVLCAERAEVEAARGDAAAAARWRGHAEGLASMRGPGGS